MIGKLMAFGVGGAVGVGAGYAYWGRKAADAVPAGPRTLTVSTSAFTIGMPEPRDVVMALPAPAVAPASAVMGTSRFGSRVKAPTTAGLTTRVKGGSSNLPANPVQGGFGMLEQSSYNPVSTPSVLSGTSDGKLMVPTAPSDYRDWSQARVIEGSITPRGFTTSVYDPKTMTYHTEDACYVTYGWPDGHTEIRTSGCYEAEMRLRAERSGAAPAGILDNSVRSRTSILDDTIRSRRPAVTTPAMRAQAAIRAEQSPRGAAALTAQINALVARTR